MLTSPWRQFRVLSRLFGVRSLLRMKKNHDAALPHIRGYVTTSCIWALLECGFMDAVSEPDGVDATAFAAQHGMDLSVIEALAVYLDGLSILRKVDGRYLLDVVGQQLMAEPRGFFDLMRGYKPVLEALTPLLRGTSQYRRDVSRDAEYVARGSGALGADFPFPMMRDLFRTHGKFNVLDIGCGDLDLLLCCAEDTRFECWGFDNDPVVVAQAEARLRQHPARERVHVCEADMFALEGAAAQWDRVDALCAVDVFHEHLWDGPDRVQELLHSFRTHFPNAWLFVAEFCHPSHAWLRKHPTPLLDHEVCHALTHQRIQDEDAWVDMFTRAGYAVEEARVFPFMGLGYFALR